MAHRKKVLLKLIILGDSGYVSIVNVALSLSLSLSLSLNK
jgi:hypothetical protein